jgi:hypothetical protein
MAVARKHLDGRNRNGEDFGRSQRLENIDRNRLLVPVGRGLSAAQQQKGGRHGRNAKPPHSCRQRNPHRDRLSIQGTVLLRAA